MGKQVGEWRSKLRGEERNRSARLAKLLALARAGDVSWKVYRSAASDEVRSGYNRNLRLFSEQVWIGRVKLESLVPLD
jgi:hypothetical protein